MPNKIYGIDLDKKITPLIVRDAIVSCFFKAHCEDTGVEEDKLTNKEYCRMIVEKSFEEVNGNFDDPSKEDIVNVVARLADFSKSFRDPKIILKHKDQIELLLSKL
ncbi:hypothetical protein C0580_03495 [Candidatus Parcubacteria bacterium]|nr:MAG: hypothetical protein C0580_03495 [Candidatus Parcubacteria bacterium]